MEFDSVENRYSFMLPEHDDIFGLVLDQNLTLKDVAEDPLIKHFSQANHFFDYNMSRRRTRLALRIKFFFADFFKRDPNKKKKKP